MEDMTFVNKKKRIEKLNIELTTYASALSFLLLHAVCSCSLTS